MEDKDSLIEKGYNVSRKIIENSKYSVIISILWLMYFPLTGVQWFDFHFMALFPTLFLIGSIIITETMTVIIGINIVYK